MATYLITGATGFLGSHLVDRLKRAGCGGPGAPGLRVLCRGPSPWDHDPAVEVVRGDVLDRAAVDRAVDGATGIYHLAGRVHRDPARAADLFAVHVEGTRQVCESALAHGRPRIVLASSSGTVAVSAERVLHTEQAPFALDIVRDWPYYVSKIRQEELARQYVRDRGLPVMIAGPSLLLGPGDARRSSTGDVQAFLDGYVFTIPGGALNFVDARDVAIALPQIMSEGVPGARYLLGGHNMDFDEFFSRLAVVSGRARPKVRVSEGLARTSAAAARVLYRVVGRTFPLDDVSIRMAYRFWLIDNSFARDTLAFRPRPADETLRDTVEDLRWRARGAGA